MNMEALRIQLSQLRATKIRMENEHDTRLTNLEAEIERVETKLVAAEEAEWARVGKVWA